MIPFDVLKNLGGKDHLNMTLLGLNQKPFVEGKNVLLVDDVYNTGTTMSECAKVLKESGVNKVVGFAFAKSRI